MIQNLFTEILKANKAEFSELRFDLYEDRENYTIEAVFDDEALVIGREAPTIVCGREKAYNAILKETKLLLGGFYKANRAQLSNIKEISYGFVDGDLYYIKKRRQCRKNQRKFTAEDFADFNDVKLKAWISVYTDEARRERDSIDAFSLNQLKEGERERYIYFLAENFDYEKYAKLK